MRCNNSVTIGGQAEGYLGKLRNRREINLMKRVAVLVVGILALGAMVWAQNPLLINGAGATFPYPIYSKWFDEYSLIKYPGLVEANRPESLRIKLPHMDFSISPESSKSPAL